MPHMRARLRMEVDASLRRHSAKGVDANLPSSVSANMPTLARARNRRYSESACADAAAAKSPTSLGPFASRSAIPSVAATDTACVIHSPVSICKIICEDSGSCAISGLDISAPSQIALALLVPTYQREFP